MTSCSISANSLKLNKAGTFGGFIGSVESGATISASSNSFTGTTSINGFNKKAGIFIGVMKGSRGTISGNTLKVNSGSTFGNCPYGLEVYNDNSNGFNCPYNYRTTKSFTGSNAITCTSSNSERKSSSTTSGYSGECAIIGQSSTTSYNNTIISLSHTNNNGY